MVICQVTAKYSYKKRKNCKKKFYSTLITNSKRFYALLNLKLLKERRHLINLDNDVIMKCSKIPKKFLHRRIELGNSDFRNQRTRVSIKNSYVAKNQTKMPVGVTF